MISKCSQYGPIAANVGPIGSKWDEFCPRQQQPIPNTDLIGVNMGPIGSQTGLVVAILSLGGPKKSVYLVAFYHVFCTEPSNDIQMLPIWPNWGQPGPYCVQIGRIWPLSTATYSRDGFRWGQHEPNWAPNRPNWSRHLSYFAVFSHRDPHNFDTQVCQLRRIMCQFRQLLRPRPGDAQN